MTDEKHDQQDEAPEGSDASQASDDLTIPDATAAGAESEVEVEEPSLDLHLRGEDAIPDEPEGESIEPPADMDEFAPASTDAPDTEDVPPTEPPPAYEPPYAPIHHRLMRRPEGKLIAGVCSGLGAYTNTDPVLWRIGFVIFGLTSVGVLAYIVA